MAEEIQTNDGSTVEQVFDTKTKVSIIMSFVNAGKSEMTLAEIEENMRMTNPSNGLKDLLDVGVVIKSGEVKTDSAGQNASKYRLANPSLRVAVERLEGALGATIQTRAQTEDIVESVLVEMGADPDGAVSF